MSEGKAATESARAEAAEAREEAAVVLEPPEATAADGEDGRASDAAAGLEGRAEPAPARAPAPAWTGEALPRAPRAPRMSLREKGPPSAKPRSTRGNRKGRARAKKRVRAKRGGFVAALLAQIDADHDGLVNERDVVRWARDNNVPEEYAREVIEGVKVISKKGIKLDDLAESVFEYDLVYDRGGPAGPEESWGFEGSVVNEAWRRAQWCIGLMMLQSASSTVLRRYEPLLKAQPVVATYLTTLLGVAGSAGSQSAVKAIRAISTAKVTVAGAAEFTANALRHQLHVGVLLAVPVGVACFLRVLVQQAIGRASHAAGPRDPVFRRALVEAKTLAMVAVALCIAGAVLGTLLPPMHLVLRQAPANGATSLPVLLDIAGVALTCIICSRALVAYGDAAAASVGGSAAGARMEAVK